MAKKDNTVLIIIGILVALYLLGNSDFFASIVTTCTNNEPTNIDGFRDTITAINGTFLSNGNYDIPYGNETLSFPKYTSTSKLGSLTLINSSDWACNNLLSAISLMDNTSSYVLLNQKQVLLVSGGLYWCSNLNNVAIYSANIADLSAYDDHYISCSSVVVEDSLSLENACEATDGVWLENTCECPGGYSWEEEEGCQEVTTTSPNTGGYYIPPQTQTTNDVPQPETSRYDLKLIVSAIAVIIILFTLYWMFEKGPNKGLIQTKRRRRRRK